jgi:hypothetical protein
MGTKDPPRSLRSQVHPDSWKVPHSLLTSTSQQWKPKQGMQLSFPRYENMEVTTRVTLLTHTAHQSHQHRAPGLVICHKLPHHSPENVCSGFLNSLRTNSNVSEPGWLCGERTTLTRHSYLLAESQSTPLLSNHYTARLLSYFCGEYMRLTKKKRICLLLLILKLSYKLP